MKNKISPIKCIVSLLLFLSFTFISNAQQNSTEQKAITTKVTPFYIEPRSDLLPKGYLKKGEMYVIQDVTVDTVGIPWFCINAKAETVWSPAKYWVYVSEIDTSAYAEGKQSEADKKRRLRILLEHRDWPRRIIRSVRFGRICLDMTSEQLTAAWDTPIQKNSAFTIGLGNHDIWLFKNQVGNFNVVLLKNDKVIGWTTK